MTAGDAAPRNTAGIPDPEDGSGRSTAPQDTGSGAAARTGESAPIEVSPSAGPGVVGAAGPGAVRPGPLDWGDEQDLAEVAPAPARGGRYPVAAIALLAFGAAALWGSSRLTWVTVTSADGLTEPRTDELNGGVWFGALTPLALVLLAAIAAVLATKGWVRRLVGVVVALIAAVTAVPALALLTGSGATEQRAADLAELPGRAEVQELVTAGAPAVLTLCGALAAFGAGLLLARMPSGAKQLSGKYDNPATRKAAATRAVQERESGDVLPERVLWDALDAGADPTDPTGPAESPDLPGATARPRAAGTETAVPGSVVPEQPHGDPAGRDSAADPERDRRGSGPADPPGTP
nr:TIGR02234 family membrane protein [Nocardia carnea]